MFYDDPTITAVAAQSGQPEDVVRAVFTALEQVHAGEPVGTVMQDPRSGSIAVRVEEGGLLLWKVTAIDGNEWRDMQPALNGWVVLYEPK